MLVTFLQDHYYVLRMAALKVNPEIGPIIISSQAPLHWAPDLQQTLRERDLVSFGLLGGAVRRGGGGALPQSSAPHWSGSCGASVATLPHHPLSTMGMPLSSDVPHKGLAPSLSSAARIPPRTSIQAYDMDDRPYLPYS